MKKKDVPNKKTKTNKEESNDVGRPKADFYQEIKEGIIPKDWYKQIIKLYEQGASNQEIKALIYSWRGSFSNDLWDRWIEENEEFSETISGGKMLSEAWWHKRGRINLINPAFSPQLWYMNMKNRFGWKDKHELSGNADEPIRTITGMQVT